MVGLQDILRREYWILNKELRMSNLVELVEVWQQISNYDQQASVEYSYACYKLS